MGTRLAPSELDRNAKLDPCFSSAATPTLNILNTIASNLHQKASCIVSILKHWAQ